MVLITPGVVVNQQVELTDKVKIEPNIEADMRKKLQLLDNFVFFFMNEKSQITLLEISSFLPDYTPNKKLCVAFKLPENVTSKDVLATAQAPSTMTDSSVAVGLSEGEQS